MKSFEQLYSEFVNKVYGYLKARLSDEFTINDIMQETFLAVWKNSHQYSGGSSVSTWILGIARNKMMDTLRKRYKAKDETAFLDDGFDQPYEDDFTDRLANEIEMQKIIGSLSPDAKELIYLVFNMKMSYKEVAALLGIPEGTVKSRVYNLKLQIRKRLEEGGDRTE